MSQTKDLPYASPIAHWRSFFYRKPEAFRAPSTPPSIVEPTSESDDSLSSSSDHSDVDSVHEDPPNRDARILSSSDDYLPHDVEVSSDEDVPPPPDNTVEDMHFHENDDETFPVSPRKYAPLDAGEKETLRSCLDRETKRIVKGDVSDALVQKWKEEEGRAEDIRTRFDENMRVLQTEIRDLEKATEEMKRLMEEDDDEAVEHESLYTSPEERKKILEEVHNDPRYLDLLRTLKQQRSHKADLEQGRDVAGHLQDENASKAQIVELRKRIREVEKDVHVFESAEVANRTSKQLLEMASERMRSRSSTHGSLLQAHQREKRGFDKRLQSAVSALSQGRAKIKEGRQHAEDLRSELQLAHKDSMEAIADLCRNNKILAVPNVASASYDAVVARILEKFARIKSPPSFDEDWTPACKLTGPIEPNVYQKIPAALANPDNGTNLLVYHDMGTGKTCTLVMILLQLAIYYWNHPGDGAAGCLVLVQNDNAVTAYTTELFSKQKRCGYDVLDHFRKETGATMESTGDFEASANVGVSEGSSESKKSAKASPEMKWTFNNSDGHPFFVVVFNKMSRRLSSRPEGWVDELPNRGVVIVDEAHNLEDPLNMKTKDKNHVSDYLAQLEEHGKNLKLIFLTGTPTTGRLWRLLKLLELLTKKKYPLLEAAKKLPLKEPTKKEQDMHDKLDEKLAEAFFDKEGSKYVWKKEALDRFRETLKGTVSYVTLANDPQVFARFAVSLNVPLVHPGEDESPSRRLSPSTSNGAVLVQSGNGFDVEAANTGMEYVLVKTQMQKSFKSKKKEEDVKSHDVFVSYKKEAVVPAWDAVFSLVSANNRNKKHFFFYDFPSRVAVPADFGKAFVKKFFDADDALMMKLLRDAETIPTFRSVIRAIFQKSSSGITCTPDLEPELVRKFKEATNGRGVAVDITGKSDDGPESGENLALFECIYNHAENKEGKLIKYVFAGKGQKEGLSLYSTQFVHVLSPPTSERSLQQAVRRTLRFCGMKDLDKKNWVVTVLLYCADADGKKCCRDRYCDKLKTWSIMPGTSSEPVDLVLEALQENAVDCEILQPLTKVKCHGDSARGGKKPVCVSLWGSSPSQVSEKDPDCHENLRLPDASAMDEASSRDEQLRVLLNRDEGLKRMSAIRLKKPSVTAGFDLSPTKSAMDLYHDLMQDQTLAEAVRRFLTQRHAKLSKDTQRSLASETKKSLSAYEKLADTQRRVREHHKSYLHRSELDQTHRQEDVGAQLREEAVRMNLLKKH